MPVRSYRSGNVNAPVLTNGVGTLIPVLDMLVNGTTTASVTSITRSGAIATVTTAVNHGYVNLQLVTIAGANEPEYNGEFVITVTGLTQFTYTVVGTPATPATGTITYRLAGSGWTKPFTGTNLAMYRQPSGSNMFYFRVDDTSATVPLIRGFETASDITGGTGPFPTVAQMATGGFLFKNAATVPYVIVCNGPTVYLWINTGNVAGAGTTAQMFTWGDFTSYKTGDIYNTLICTEVTSATLNDTVAITANAAVNTAYLSVVAAGFWATRSHTQIGSAVTLGRHTDVAKTSNTAVIGSNGIAYPSAVDGGLYIAPIFVHENALAVIRGSMNGIWAPCHNRAIGNGDTFAGTGTLAGKNFEAFHNNATGQVFLEMSNTW
jgi:hypothetical protein